MVWLYAADPHKIAVIPPGVDLNVFSPQPQQEARRSLGLPPDRRVVLFVGRIDPLKGIDVLLRALALVAAGAAEQDDLSLIVVGGAPGAGAAEAQRELARLNRLRAELGIEHLVTFQGAQNQDTLVTYYTAADVVVMPSRYESFGMVALEAMACGTPVIASKVGGLAFSVQDGETGFLVPERDVDALAARLRQVLCDHELRLRLGRQAAEWARGYGWPAIAAQILDLFERLQPAAFYDAASSG
jgi:D-inositol-3-phosphate glycosyltransferase